MRREDLCVSDTEATTAPTPETRRAAGRRTRVCDRDRMLAVMDGAPHLSNEESAFVDRIVREAREASISDAVSA
jgi:hypothetical protein